LTASWGFKQHTTFLKEARREGVVGIRRPPKSAEMIGESLEFKEELEINVMVVENGGTGYIQYDK
jgi:hypothetical protein